jgi:hypothetical protein
MTLNALRACCLPVEFGELQRCCNDTAAACKCSQGQEATWSITMIACLTVTY